LALILRRQPARQGAALAAGTEDRGRVKPANKQVRNQVATGASVKAAAMPQAERRGRN